MLLTSHCFLLCMAYHAILVFRWRVNRIEFQVTGLRGVDHVVSGTRWDDDPSSVLDTVFYTVNSHFSFSFFKPKELVNIFMGFFTYLFTRLNAHEYELTVLPCVQYTAEISVFHRFFLNSDYISLHTCHLNLSQCSVFYLDFSAISAG